MDNNANGGTPPANAGGDANNNNANANATGTPPAGTPPANGGGANGDSNANANAGETQLTEAQLAQAFQHPRFKELNEKAKLADKLKGDQEAAEKKRLEESGEHQKLAEQYKADADKATGLLNTERKNNALIIEANKLGAHDASVVAKLIDSNAITIDENGAISGVSDALKALQAANPYLFKTGSGKSMGGSDTNPAGGGNADFTYSQFKDAKFYQEHAKEMDKALVENRVDMTR